MRRSPATPLLAALATVLATVLAACAGPDAAGRAPAAGAAVAATDATGHEVRLAQPARRVVSLVPAVTDILVAIGAGEQLVGRTNYDTSATLAALPSVGGGLDPSLEALLALRPDLVIAWEDRAGRTNPRLAEAGVGVFNIVSQDTADVFENAQRLGRLTGHDSAATALVARLRRELAAVHASVQGRPAPRVLYLAQWEPPMTAGPGTFVMQLVSVAGGQSVFADVQQDWPSISMEEIVRRQPDVILVAVNRVDADPMRRLRDNPGWRDLRAVREGHVLVMPGDLLDRSGPRVGEAAHRLRDLLHPELAGVPLDTASGPARAAALPAAPTP